ncbi:MULTISPECIES: toxin-antitoxin system YwqK family antitoxin [Aequorivita]|uniref:Toxin-antitoxin system YwqK family antitoxin n=1 Tax=Aequorivita iocasae TaxID=2803865 RepID=A0ABX7DV99_9FLAO|nr:MULTISPECIES: hypothetical protein [Aequorivita]QQX77725.1 hypothetical protein JK629_05535 [Aequorivita iocasae]UCA57223.1 hypothetical protein LDL78_05560 [Aequorivita sp. F7]
MVKKLLLFASFSILLFSCNKVIDAVDEVRMNSKQTITYDDFEVVRNDYDIKLYYDNDKELMTGHYVVVYQGKPSEEFQTKRGFLNGVYASYNADGQLTKGYNYKDGKQEGLQREFYGSGELLSEASFKKGKMVGEKVVYDQLGEVRAKHKIENGVEYKRYFKNGKMAIAEFKRNWEGKVLDMMVYYDAFENIQFAFGKSSDPNEKNIFYVFDANMQLSDTVDITIDPQKASYYMGLIQRTAMAVME